MRLLFVCGGAYVAGAEIHMLQLMSGLQAHGHAVHCSISGWNDGDFARRLTAAGIPHTPIKLGTVYARKPWWTLATIAFYPSALAAHARLIREFQPDWTYHASPRTVQSLRPVLDPARTAVHIVETPPGNPERRDSPARLANRVRVVFANSSFVASRLVAAGLPPERIVVSYPPVGLDGPPHGDGGGASPRIGIVGQIIRRKGHEDLLRALAVLANREMPFTLEVYGQGPDTDQAAVRQQASDLGLAGRVNFHGFVKDRSAIYGALDLVVVPTRDEEAFGMAAAEPGLAGLPVVASRGGGLIEVVRDNQTGLLFERGNVTDLADKVGRLLVDPELRRRLGGRAREWVSERFGVEPAVSSVETALAALYQPARPAKTF